MLGRRRKSVLFHRDFGRFTGGHLKVWHYFLHVRASALHEPRIHFTPASRLDETNPWCEAGLPAVADWNPAAADVLFVAGMDWAAVPGDNATPVVNLIQSVQHAQPDDPRYSFLARPAVRICVSQQVSDAVLATGRVNGPVFTIPNAVDHESLPEPAAVRDIPLFIGGCKNPSLAAAVEERLVQKGLRVVSQTSHLPRAAFLELLGRARVALLLPCATEGCYLPALEAMALETLVVCPDCVGNRTFCRDGDTAFRPGYTLPAIEQAVLRACGLSQADHDRMVRAGLDEARLRTLGEERRLFLDILADLPAVR